jgi:hypothetical protein
MSGDSWPMFCWLGAAGVASPLGGVLIAVVRSSPELGRSALELESYGAPQRETHHE